MLKQLHIGLVGAQEAQRLQHRRGARVALELLEEAVQELGPVTPPNSERREAF